MAGRFRGAFGCFAEIAGGGVAASAIGDSVMPSMVASSLGTRKMASTKKQTAPTVVGAVHRRGGGVFAERERVMGFEPTTHGLGSRSSTAELHPHGFHYIRFEKAVKGRW